MNTQTTATDATPAAPAAGPKLAKTATITLRAADGSVMYIVAERKADGARTYVITTDAAKNTSRGMTEQHATFEAARAAIAIRASQAEKLGWIRRAAARGFAPKLDAFATLPPAPKAVPATPKTAPKGKK